MEDYPWPRRKLDSVTEIINQRHTVLWNLVLYEWDRDSYAFLFVVFFIHKFRISQKIFCIFSFLCSSVSLKKISRNFSIQKYQRQQLLPIHLINITDMRPSFRSRRIIVQKDRFKHYKWWIHDSVDLSLLIIFFSFIFLLLSSISPSFTFYLKILYQTLYYY